MKVIFFLLYYFKLRIGVRLGVQQTSHPLGWRWRWKFWYARQRRIPSNRVCIR